MSLKRLENLQRLTPHLASISLLALVSTLVYLIRNNGNVVHLDPRVFLQQGQIGNQNNSKIGNENNSSKACNLFSGKWVYDNISYPLYNEKKCTFLDYEFGCVENGRKDLKYQNWRWQPHTCDLPRFNSTALLEKIKGKKLVFVGDSLNRNQWTSMLCLLQQHLSVSPKTSNRGPERIDNLYYHHVAEYNATIGFYWSPMLVESNCDEIKPNRNWPHVARIKSIERHGKYWIDADILVFDSFAWWMTYEITILWGSFGSPHAVYKTKMNRLRRYEIALSTWSDWVEVHVNRTRTKLFFMSASPFRPGRTRWSTDPSCYKKSEPTFNESYVSSFMNRDMMYIVESTIEKLLRRGVKVEYLNITELSAHREDAHPATDRLIRNPTLTKDQWKNPAIYSDCLHWCLPGVPDIWNEILYAYIMKL
ncbi:hypothetical protein CASFOL_000671 [Castilleja foliolosa]|uniref:Trichome birefringence-like N-terminal domain-containing protein n=1 Tax=Castilleja foliolosa TaxID=1961234 RepID=A0ABD3EKD9_9LAMI